LKLGALKYLLLVIWLAYFLLPIDLLPDMMGIVGRLDDFALGAYLVYRYLKAADRIANMHKRDAERDAASKQEPKEETVDQSPLEVLGVGNTANEQEVRDAYRQKMAEYHPDKVNHLGEDLKELAHRKCLAIQAAFEQLRSERGW